MSRGHVEFPNVWHSIQCSSLFFPPTATNPYPSTRAWEGKRRTTRYFSCSLLFTVLTCIYKLSTCITNKSQWLVGGVSCHFQRQHHPPPPTSHRLCRSIAKSMSVLSSGVEATASLVVSMAQSMSLHLLQPFKTSLIMKLPNCWGSPVSARAHCQSNCFELSFNG